MRVAVTFLLGSFGPKAVSDVVRLSEGFPLPVRLSDFPDITLTCEVASCSDCELPILFCFILLLLIFFVKLL